MTAPEAFMNFTAFFHQDFDSLFPNGDGLIEDAISQTPQDQQNIIKDYLDELLSGKFTEEQLRLIWRNSRAEISPFRDQLGSCTDFLKLLRTFFS